MSLVSTYLKFKYLETTIVVDPTVCCKPWRLLLLPAFRPTIQALINKMMCHPANQLSSCAGPRKPMGFLAPEPTDQSSREQLHFPSLSSPSFTDILSLSYPPPQVYPPSFSIDAESNFPPKNPPSPPPFPPKTLPSSSPQLSMLVPSYNHEYSFIYSIVLILCIPIIRVI